MLTSSIPSTWRDLQQQVADILSECGFCVSLEKTITTARGEVEVDVHAVESIMGRQHTLLVECKHWRRRVPKSVVHSFRTVVGDAGANTGYVLSVAGFQSGAATAALHSNVKLLNWPEFQQELESSWIENYLYPTVEKDFDRLFTFIEPFLPQRFAELSEEGKENYLKIKDRHDAFGWLMMMFTRYFRGVVAKRVNGNPLPALPLRPLPDVVKPETFFPDDLLDSTGYRDFLLLASSHKDDVIREFESSLKHREV